MMYLDRFKSDDDGTFGALMDGKGKQLCFTCELPWKDNHAEISCIPTGLYWVEAFDSPKHGGVWKIMNVPGRSNIEIHGGNTIQDLLGCICVGNAMGKINGLPAVLNSQNTLAMLRTLIPDYFQLTITGIL